MTFIIDCITLHGATAMHQQHLASGVAEVTMDVRSIRPHGIQSRDPHLQQPDALGGHRCSKMPSQKLGEREDQRMKVGWDMCADRDKQVVSWLSGSNAWPTPYLQSVKFGKEPV